MRKTTLQLKKVKVNKRTYWQLTKPKPGGHGRERIHFKDKADADLEFEKAEKQIARFGTQAMELSDRLRVQAIEGAKKLEPYGATIAQAVDYYAKYLESKRGGIPLPQVVAELIAEKKADELSSRYQQDLRLRLGRFIKAFPEKTTREITTADIDGFLTGLGVAIGTVRTFRRDLRTLFKFAINKGYAEKNPTDGVRNPKQKARGKIEILSIEQTLRLLNGCDDAILPAVVIAAFCGLRQAELERLQWSAVDLEEKIITVDGSIAKTGSRRTVDIPDNAIAWITALAKREGSVMPSDFRRLFDRARVRAGYKPSFEGREDDVLKKLLEAADKNAKTKGQKKVELIPWPANCLRHGAISYRIAQSGDVGKVATSAGNSRAVIMTNYLSLVRPSEATAFFSILPGVSADILHFNPKAA